MPRRNDDACLGKADFNIARVANLMLDVEHGDAQYLKPTPRIC